MLPKDPTGTEELTLEEVEVFRVRVLAAADGAGGLSLTHGCLSPHRPERRSKP